MRTVTLAPFTRAARLVVPLAAAYVASFAAPAAAAAHPDTAAAAAPAAAIRGHVVDVQGITVGGMTVVLTGARTERPLLEVRSGPDGAFSFAAVPAPASYRLAVMVNGEPAGDALRVDVGAAESRSVTVTFRPAFLGELMVTDTREAHARSETPASVGTIDRATIEAVRPTHPSEVLGRVAGVWVNVTGGEGHMTAIRQPLTTNPVYLYLEDGVPTRSTGFFNHNALYEINVPMADGIEVTKGPGSALYGSDAIGGVINVLTRSPFDRPGAEVAVDRGSFGWRRLLASGDFAGSGQAVRLDVNVTHSDGWRDATAYDRSSVTARWDRVAANGTFVKTVLATSDIDQQTAGSSALPAADYEDDPTLNLTPISFRRVKAFRLSSEVSHTRGAWSVSAIPFVRWNEMELLANWSLSYDPTVYTTKNASAGILAKARRTWTPMRAELALGVDVDYSPGSFVEDRIEPGTTTLPGGQRGYSSYTVGPRIYDYDVTYLNVAPFVHAEVSPLARMRVSAGLRFDHSAYDYDDLLETPATPRYRRPADGRVSYRHASPKLGVTWELAPWASAFAAYRHAFRTPSQNQVFRQGSAGDTLGLKPVKADNVEIGLRLAPAPGLSAELSVYRLSKRDDILSFRDPVDGSTQVVNAGKTRHEGVEASVNAGVTDWLDLAAAYTHAVHRYVDWVVDPGRGLDYSGKEMETAPRDLGRLSATLKLPSRPRASLALEWVRLGGYWMDAANTHRYAGHDLVNLRAAMPISEVLQGFAQVTNATDARYAESSSYTQNRGEELAPGMPRAVFVGVQAGWAR